MVDCTSFPFPLPLPPPPLLTLFPVPPEGIGIIKSIKLRLIPLKRATNVIERIGVGEEEEEEKAAVSPGYQEEEEGRKGRQQALVEEGEKKRQGCQENGERQLFWAKELIV